MDERDTKLNHFLHPSEEESNSLHQLLHIRITRKILLEENIEADKFYFDNLADIVVINTYIEYQEIKLGRIDPTTLTEEDFKNFWIQFLHKREAEQLVYQQPFINLYHIKHIFEESNKLNRDLISANKIRNNKKNC